MAQVNGRDNLSIKEKVYFDLKYKQSLSLYMDFKILFTTFLRVIQKKILLNNMSFLIIGSSKIVEYHIDTLIAQSAEILGLASSKIKSKNSIKICRKYKLSISKNGSK